MVMNSKSSRFFSCKYLLGASFTIVSVFAFVIISPIVESGIIGLCDETAPELHSIIKDSEPVKKFKELYSDHAIETLVLVKPLSNPLLDYSYTVTDGNATRILSKSIYVCGGEDSNISLTCYQKTPEFPGFLSPGGELLGGEEVYNIRNETEILKHLDNYDCLGS